MEFTASDSMMFVDMGVTLSALGALAEASAASLCLHLGAGLGGLGDLGSLGTLASLLEISSVGAILTLAAIREVIAIELFVIVLIPDSLVDDGCVVMEHGVVALELDNVGIITAYISEAGKRVGAVVGGCVSQPLVEDVSRLESAVGSSDVLEFGDYSHIGLFVEVLGCLEIEINVHDGIFP